jgi:hypothetical protein
MPAALAALLWREIHSVMAVSNTNLRTEHTWGHVLRTMGEPRWASIVCSDFQSPVWPMILEVEERRSKSLADSFRSPSRLEDRLNGVVLCREEA